MSVSGGGCEVHKMDVNTHWVNCPGRHGSVGVLLTYLIVFLGKAKRGIFHLLVHFLPKPATSSNGPGQRWEPDTQAGSLMWMAGTYTHGAIVCHLPRWDGMWMSITRPNTHPFWGFWGNTSPWGRLLNARLVHSEPVCLVLSPVSFISSSLRFLKPSCSSSEAYQLFSVKTQIINILGF